MMDLILKSLPDTAPSWCSLCGEPLPASHGPQLVQTPTEEPVCRECGQKHAPELTALQDLAHVAERVGRVCRHVLVPPMEALLALARGAEDYCHAGQQMAHHKG